jgi:hypothetical protein
VVDGTEGSALGGRKGPGAGREIVADRREKSGRIGTDLEAFKSGPRTPSEILSSDRTSSRSFLPAHRRPFVSSLHFPVALPTGEAGRSLDSARGARGWQP